MADLFVCRPDEPQNVASLRRVRSEDHDRLLVRVPTDNRPDAAGDWGLLLAVVTGLDRDGVQASPAGKSVVISRPDQPAHRRRLADWFRPFLNAAVSFAAAQQRLAAEACGQGAR